MKPPGTFFNALNFQVPVGEAINSHVWVAHITLERFLRENLSKNFSAAWIQSTLTIMVFRTFNQGGGVLIQVLPMTGVRRCSSSLTTVTGTTTSP